MNEKKNAKKLAPTIGEECKKVRAISQWWTRRKSLRVSPRESILCRDVRNPNDWRPTAAKLSPLSLWPGTLQYHRYSFNASFPCQEGWQTRVLPRNIKFRSEVTRRKNEKETRRNRHEESWNREGRRKWMTAHGFQFYHICKKLFFHLYSLFLFLPLLR